MGIVVGNIMEASLSQRLRQTSKALKSFDFFGLNFLLRESFLPLDVPKNEQDYKERK